VVAVPLLDTLAYDSVILELAITSMCLPLIVLEMSLFQKVELEMATPAVYATTAPPPPASRFASDKTLFPLNLHSLTLAPESMYNPKAPP